MKLIFLNTWNGKEQEAIAEFISQNSSSTDIFCFQEAYEKMATLCRQLLPNYRELHGHKYISEEDQFPQATYIKNDIEVLSSGTLLEDQPNCGLGIYMLIEVKGRRLYVCNFHGIARPGNKLDNPDRLRQSQALIEFFEDKEDPVIIGGDFNILDQTDSIRMFEKQGYRDLIKEFAIKTTRNHFVWDQHPGDPYYHSDYIFMKGDLKLNYFSVPENSVSDHLPLIVDIDSMQDTIRKPA